MAQGGEGAPAFSYSHDFLLAGAGNLGPGRTKMQVDFGAHAEGAAPGGVNAGLDGEAAAGNDFALVVGFVVIQIGAGGVDLAAQGVASAVHEIVAETGGGDHP